MHCSWIAPASFNAVVITFPKYSISFLCLWPDWGTGKQLYRGNKSCLCTVLWNAQSKQTRGWGMGIEWEFVFLHHFTFLVPIAGFLKRKGKKRQIGLLAVSLRIINKGKIVYIIHKHLELDAFYFNLLGHEVVPARLISHWGIQHSCSS